MTKTKQTKAIVQAGEAFNVPLNTLKKSPKNVRKVPHGEAAIASLAASIAANGLLQNLVVEPELKDGKPTGCYLVNIGEGRRLALLLRAKRKEIAKAEPVRCVLGDADKAEEASLAENVVRTAMHPADEYEAFASLQNDKGMAADDIAARFGVTPAVVRQRLKLGAVSPVLMGLYRKNEMTLEQLMAFTLTDDHARQEEVWQSLGWDNGASAIRRALTEGQVATTDRRVRFVGSEAYEQAGGVIVRDLFDERGGGFVTDAALLDRLVRAKLEQEAQAVRAEGWTWVMVAPEFDHRMAADMRRVYAGGAMPDAETEDRLTALSAEYDDLALAIEAEEACDGVPARLEAIEAEIDALQGTPVFKPEDIARGGVFVSLGYDGGLRIERGFIRRADEAARSAGEAPAGDTPAADKPRGLPDRLVADLTAHRTAALRDELAKRPEVALVAVVHALATQTFYHGARLSCLELTLRSEMLSRHAPGIDHNGACQAVAERHEKLAASLPDDPAELWDALSDLSQQELLVVLAHCAALTVHAVAQTQAESARASQSTQKLVEAVSLDMCRHWQPTATGYLGRIQKPLIVEAVREAVSRQAADNIATMKKGAMAEAAERLLTGKDWLPPVLRRPQPSANAEAA